MPGIVNIWNDALLAACFFTIFLELGRGESDLRYLPLCDVAGTHSPLVGLADLLINKGTVTQGFVERLAGRVDGRIPIDQGETRHRYEAVATWTTGASRCFHLRGATLTVR